jgi:hypothetical protein
MDLTAIKYNELNSKQKELYNFQKLAGLLADYGYNCIKLADDWEGADFLAYHNDGSQTHKIQLKGRLAIAKKYLEKDIHIAFPMKSEWYIVPHETLILLVSTHTNWLNTSSWKDAGQYNSANPNLELIASIQKYRVGKSD